MNDRPLSERVREWDAINLETILAWADEIAALEQERDRLRAAMSRAVELCECDPREQGDGMADILRAAIGGDDE